MMFAPESNQSELRRYEQDAHKSYDMLFKIVLTGDANTGKSRILQQFINGKSGQQVPTIGVEFTSKLMQLEDGSIVNLQLWDTAGCETF